MATELNGKLTQWRISCQPERLTNIDIGPAFTSVGSVPLKRRYRRPYIITSYIF
ncbi:MAG: hypothetical protein JWN70_5663 [Planctomycetaceae bacterium]|nr:hypothetical protein [Planctomycetaceae bacterium]